MKKPLAFLLALITALTLAACAPAGTPSATPSASASAAATTAVVSASTAAASTPPAAVEPPPIVEISSTMFDRGVPADAGTADENAVTAFINEQLNPLGVNIKWMSAPRNDARTVYNTWIAAGTAPDLLWEYSRPWMDQLRTQKTIMPIEELVDRHSTVYKDYAARNEDMLRSYVQFDDGHTYAACSLRGVETLPTAGISYRQDVLDRAGYTGPIDTMDDIMKAARAVKAFDSGMVPIAASLHYVNVVLGVYGIGSQEALDSSGSLIPLWQSDRYKSAMECLRAQYMEGLVDPEWLTDESYARQTSLYVNGKTAFAFNGLGQPTGMAELVANEPDAVAGFRSAGAIASEYGEFMLTPQPAAWIYVMFTSGMAEEKIKAAFTYIDWLLTPKDSPSPNPLGPQENWADVAWGLEGTTWNFDDTGMRKNIEGAPWWGGGEYAFVQNAPSLIPGQLAARGATAAEEANSAQIEWAMYDLMSHPISNVLPYDFTDEEFSALNTSFNPLRADIETRIYTDKGYSADQGIADLQAAWDSLNGPAIWEKKLAWYKANEDALSGFNSAYSTWTGELVSVLKQDKPE